MIEMIEDQQIKYSDDMLFGHTASNAKTNKDRWKEKQTQDPHEKSLVNGFLYLFFSLFLVIR